MPVVYCETGIPARDVGKLRSLFDATLCPMEYSLGHDKTQLSVTAFSAVSLGGVDVIRDQGIGRRAGIRKPCHIRERYSDDFLICLPHNADVTLAQAGVRSHFSAGRFSLLSTAQPFSAVISAPLAAGPFAHTIVRVASPRLRSRVAHIDECCGLPLSIGPGSGRIMAGLFDLALAEGGALSDPAMRRFSEALLDAIADAALAAPQLAAMQATPGARNRLRERAEHFIVARLSDPDLNAELVADYCGVSSRYIRAVFADSGCTLGAFVRGARLRECRNALRAPALANRSVLEVAMLWGFNDAAWFSRAYRREFGVAPSEERRQACCSGGDKS